MRVTVIPIDKAVYIDDNIAFFDFVVDPEIPTIHAIQWHDTYGHIEHIDEFGKMIAVESIDSVDFIQSIIDQAIQIINTRSVQVQPTITQPSLTATNNTAPTVL